MRRTFPNSTALAAALLATLGASSSCLAQSEGFFAGLKGFNEVPAVSSTGIGTFLALPSADGESLSYELTYVNLVGSVEQAHIHFGQPDVNGGIVVFLCTNLAAPAGVPAPPECPQAGTVTGTLSADDIIAVAAQGIEPEDFSKLLAAMRAGRAYANVHSEIFPAGEIRGEIQSGP